MEEAYLPSKAHKAQSDGLDYVEIQMSDKTVKLNLQEVQQIERDINSQIYARDFMLIDQSDIIISFVPAFPDGRAAISSGVERELQHAHEAAKDVYVIWTSKQTPSVFVTQTATKVFQNITEAITFFEKEFNYDKAKSC